MLGAKFNVSDSNARFRIPQRYSSAAKWKGVLEKYRCPQPGGVPATTASLNHKPELPVNAFYASACKGRRRSILFHTAAR
jgi:hypothetical protein